MTPQTDFWYYGLRLRTDLALTGLPRCPGEAQAADIVLLRGDVPERLEDVVWRNSTLAIAPDHTTSVQLGNAGRVEVLRAVAREPYSGRQDARASWLQVRIKDGCHATTVDKSWYSCGCACNAVSRFGGLCGRPGGG